jgi:hypothetical protein
MVEVTVRFSESAASYAIAVAVPEKLGSGSKVTTPVVVLTVYVPSLATVNVVRAQFVVVPTAQSLSVLASNGNELEPAVSFANGLML